MKRLPALFILLMAAVHSVAAPARDTRRVLSIDDYRGKMRAAWIGKMAGVGLGIATEFRYSHRIVPDSMMPRWSPVIVNEGYNQDDLYLSVAALLTLDRHGLDVDAREAYLERADYQFEYGGRNGTFLEKRIAPPDLGHPRFKPTADGCGYTCGADFAGLIAPGLPATAVDMARIFGRSIAYGDGLEAAIFIGAMYSEAFFTEDLSAIVGAGLKAIPRESLTAKAVNDVTRWRGEFADWKDCWRGVMRKYWWNKQNNWTEWPYGGGNRGINLDSKSMAAFTAMALLYGDGDFTRTMNIAIQASEDADCDASIACGILAAAKGMKAIDERYYSALRKDVRFKYMSVGFDSLICLTERVMRANVEKRSGSIEDGKIYLPVDMTDRREERFLSSKDPGPIAGSVYNAAEMDRINLLVDPGFENQGGAWSFYSDNRANHIVPVDISLGLERFDDNMARTGFNNACLGARFENRYPRAASKPLKVGIRQRVDVQPGRTYALDCMVLSSGADLDGRCRLRVSSPGGAEIAAVEHGSSPQWTKVSLTFVGGEESSVEVCAGFYPVPGEECTVRYDDFNLRAL
jgi:hypothetical protein